LFVKAYDKDLLFDDLLGTSVTEADGSFVITSEPEDFRDLFEKRPDVYFKVFRSDRKTLLFSSEKAVRWNVGSRVVVELEIPWSAREDAAGRGVELTGDDGRPRDTFDAGDSLVVGARGLRPLHAHEVAVSIEGKSLFTSQLSTNARGEIPETVLWPQMGLEDPVSDARLTFAEARALWSGKAGRLTIESDGKVLSSASFRFSEVFSRPLVLATDGAGRLSNGFEVGRQGLHVGLYNLPTSGPVRVYMVHRQHDWREGDRFTPARLADGELAIRELELPASTANQAIELFAADRLVPGAYDFIVRPVRYGFEEDELLELRRGDVLGGRRVTGVVIREPFMFGKTVLGGCVNKLSVSGRSVSGTPYFEYADTFEAGEDIWAALDPGIVDPENISKMCALYVVPNKTALQWNTSNALAHLPVLGGNAAVTKIKVQSGCVNMNKVLLWPSALQVGEYDIVADFGNNSPDAATFTADNAYNTPLDIIDGYFVAGFRVVRDPGTMTDFSHAGTFHYDETAVASLGLPGTASVEDEAGHYSTPGVFSTVTRNVPMRAHVYFPADAASVTDPAQISASQPSYPMVVIIHGNGHSYTSYDALLEHFAKSGFVAVSINLNTGMSALGRANMLFQHLAVLNAVFAGKVQNNIGIMGHSRGGEAVLKAARLNHELALGHGINALISLAPTDQYGKESMTSAWAKPYFVLYGSRDGDIDGGIWTPGYTVPQTGFALYDRASGAQKSMAFVYRATHNGFVTTNYDAEAGDVPELLDPADQQPITRAYMNAFFRQHLKGEGAQWEGLFRGDWRPASVSPTVRLFTQYQAVVRKEVDAFTDAASNWQSSTIGGTVTHGGSLPTDPSEGNLHHDASVAGLDAKSPHDTKGLLVRWDNLNDRLDFTVPAAHKNVSSFAALSLRVSQKADSAQNPAGQPQNLRVVLRDGGGLERAIRVSAFAEIPAPDVRATAALSKSALCTIRIPLASYTIVCAGVPKVDLTNVDRVSLLFSEKVTGEIDVDSIEFTN
jgi:hypothetical protein